MKKKIFIFLNLLVLAIFAGYENTFALSFAYLKDKNGVVLEKIYYDELSLGKTTKLNAYCALKKLLNGSSCFFVPDNTFEKNSGLGILVNTDSSKNSTSSRAEIFTNDKSNIKIASSSTDISFTKQQIVQTPIIKKPNSQIILENEENIQVQEQKNIVPLYVDFNNVPVGFARKAAPAANVIPVVPVLPVTPVAPVVQPTNNNSNSQFKNEPVKAVEKPVTQNFQQQVFNNPEISPAPTTQAPRSVTNKPQIVYQIIERSVPGPQGPAGPAGRDGSGGGVGNALGYGSYSVGAQYNGFGSGTGGSVTDPSAIHTGDSASFSDLSGAGLASCNASTSKILYNSTTKLFECGTDLNNGTGGFSGGNLVGQIIYATTTLVSPILNASTTNSSTTNATTGNIINLNSASATMTNSTSTNSYSTNLFFSNTSGANSTITNSTSTNIYSSNSSITNATSTNLFASNLNSANSSSTNLFSSFANFLAAYVTTLFGNSSNFLVSNASTTNATTSNATIGNFTNLNTSFATITNSTSTNIFSTNSYLTNATITNLNVTYFSPNAISVANATLTNSSSTNLFATNFQTPLTNGFVWRGSTVNLNEATSTLFIANNGNLGIGTTTPGSDNLKVSPSTGNSTITSIAGDSVSRGIIGTGDNTRNNTLLMNSFGSTAAGTALGIPNANNSFLFTNGSTISTLAIGTRQAAPLVLGTQDAERMRIDASGNVGIGTTSPSQALSVSGNLLVSGSIISPKFTNLPSALVSDKVLCISPDGTVTEDQSGGCTGQYSDLRLKTNIATVTSALEKVKGLNTITFNWIDQARGTSTQFGYIAQDVLKVVPEVVKQDANGFYKMNYIALSALYANAIKELDDKVFKKFDEIMARITGIENRTTVLEQKVNHLENLLQVQSSADLNLNNLNTPAAPWVDPNAPVVPATPADTAPTTPVVPVVVDPQNTPAGSPTPAPVVPQTAPDSEGSYPINTPPAEAPAVTPAG